MKNQAKLLLGLVFVFSLGSRAQIVPYIADYGVPLAAETTIEIVKELLGKNFLSQWALGLLQLQSNNIQNGFSKHLQDKVASGAQSIRNSIDTAVKSENSAGFLTSMNQMRSATQKAHSTESIKSRMSMAQWLPIFDSLYELAAVQKDSQDSARIVAYAAFIIGTFLPEFNAKDPEIFSRPNALFKAGKLNVEQTLNALQTYRDWANPRLEKIIRVWATGEGNTDSLGVSDTIDWLGHGIFIAGLLLPPVAVGSFKNEVIRGSLVQSLNGNFAESLTRVNMMKLAADTRLTVQQLGMPATNRSSSSFETHQQRQFAISKTWSELGLTMRANLWRYLAILVPDLVKIALEPNTQNRAAMFASVLSYLRQYDPEYPVDDRFMRMSIQAVFGNYTFATPEFLEALEGNLRWLDPGYNDNQEVRDYYRLVLSPSSNLAPANAGGVIQAVRASGLPVFSFGISWFSEGLNAGLKVLFGYATWPAFFRETYDRVFASVIRGVGEPVKNDIQQSINDVTRTGEKSAAEARLSTGSVEMNGRLGPDAQMARAIYERLLPTFSHILDSAREAYQAGNYDRAAGLVVYLADLIATIYPEAPADDPLIASLIKTRFSSLRGGVADVAIQSLLENAILKALPTDKPVLACLLTRRLHQAELLTQNCDTENQTKWTWAEAGAQATYWGVMGAGLLLPGAFAWTKERYGNNFQNIPWAARKLSLASLGLVVTSVFNGITKGLMDWSKALAQRLAQRALISNRVDESENTGRAHEFFSARQLELQKYIPLNPQEARKDLVVILPNWALNFRKTVPDYTTFEEFLETPLGQDYAEAKDTLKPFFEEMKRVMGG